MSLETSIGRALAAGVHPVLAWRVLPARGRLAIVVGYFGAAYFGVLTVLLTLQ